MWIFQNGGGQRSGGGGGHRHSGYASSRPPSAWRDRSQSAGGLDWHEEPPATAVPPDVATALRVVREAAASGLVTEGDGDAFELPDTLVVKAAPPPQTAPPTLPLLTVKEAKHAAEQAYQKTQKQQRISWDAVRAAEAEVEQIELRLHGKQQVLVEAKEALQAASQATEAALLELNRANRAFQDEVAAAVAPGAAAHGAPASSAGKGSAGGSRASSGATKRSQPDEADAVATAWNTMRSNVAAALATGDEEHLARVTETSLQEFIALQRAEKQRDQAEAAAEADAKAKADAAAATAMGDGVTDGIVRPAGATPLANGSGGVAPAVQPPHKSARAGDPPAAETNGADVDAAADKGENSI